MDIMNLLGNNPQIIYQRGKKRKEEKGLAIVFLRLSYSV